MNKVEKQKKAEDIIIASMKHLILTEALSQSTTSMIGTLSRHEKQAMTKMANAIDNYLKIFQKRISPEFTEASGFLGGSTLQFLDAVIVVDTDKLDSILIEFSEFLTKKMTEIKSEDNKE